MIRPAAVLWDLDGTLVDTEPHWQAAELALTGAHGVEWTHEDAMGLVGSAMPHAAAILQSRGVAASIDEIIEELTGRVIDAVRLDVPWQPGAVALLAALTDADIPCALVTMSYSVLVAPILAAVPPGTFDAVVTGDRVANGKPHPEPYLTAATMLGVDVTRCVAIEDSLTGLASAHAAGAHVIGVQRAVPIPRAPGRSRIGDLTELSIDELCRVAAGEVLDSLADPDAA